MITFDLEVAADQRGIGSSDPIQRAFDLFSTQRGIAGYDPSQPRDEAGRWSDGGGRGGSENEEAGSMYAPARAPRGRINTGKVEEWDVTGQVTEVGKAWGYPKDKIKFVNGSGPEFEVDGEMMTAAGECNMKDGTVTIYTESLTEGMDDPIGLASHEIMHGVYEHVSRQYEIEQTKAFSLASKTDDVIDENMKLTERYYDQFPVLAAMQDSFSVYDDSYDKFAKEDGVTDYSKQWWREHKSGNATQHSAIHETLAEMAAHEATTGKIIGKSHYQKAYKAVKEAWTVSGGKKKKEAEIGLAKSLIEYSDAAVFVNRAFTVVPKDEAEMVIRWTKEGVLTYGMRQPQDGTSGSDEPLETDVTFYAPEIKALVRTKTLETKIARSLVKAAHKAQADRVERDVAKAMAKFFRACTGEVTRKLFAKDWEPKADDAKAQAERLMAKAFDQAKWDDKLVEAADQPLADAFLEGAVAEVGLNAAAKRKMAKYSPDQPRDELGRFGEGTGGAAPDRGDGSGAGGTSPSSGGVSSLKAVGDDPTNAWNPLLPPGIGEGDDTDAAEDAITDHLSSEIPQEAIEFLMNANKDDPGDIRQIPTKWLLTQQATVSRDIVQKYLDAPPSKEHGSAIKVGTKVVVSDGNHRIVAAMLDGKTTVNLRIIADFRKNGTRIKAVGSIITKDPDDFDDEYGDDIDFPRELPDWLREAAQDYILETFQQDYWTRINETTRNDIELTLWRAIEEGLSIRDIRDEIMESHGGQYSRARATNVARTETTSALNSGHVEGIRRAYEGTGLEPAKEWLSLLGTTTRPEHAEADGQTVGVDEDFTVGGEACSFPGDYRLSPAMRCQCQCTTVSSIVGEGIYDDETIDERSYNPDQPRVPAGSSDGGQFGSGGGGSGSASSSETVGESSVAKVGTHIGKLTGDKEAGAKLVSQIDNIDKTFGGDVKSFLEKHPLKELRVSADTKVAPGIKNSDGLYQKDKARIVMRPAEKAGDPDLFEPGSTVSIDHATSTGGGREAKLNATFTHELGHHIALTVEKADTTNSFRREALLKPFNEDDSKVSTYAATHFHEYFAESFAAYHHAPDKLSSIAKSMVEDVMRRAKEL